MEVSWPFADKSFFIEWRNWLLRFIIKRRISCSLIFIYYIYLKSIKKYIYIWFLYYFFIDGKISLWKKDKVSFKLYFSLEGTNGMQCSKKADPLCRIFCSQSRSKEVRRDHSSLSRLFRFLHGINRSKLVLVVVRKTNTTKLSSLGPRLAIR